MKRLEIYENKTKLGMLLGLTILIAIGFLIPVILYAVDPESIGLTFFILSLVVVALTIWAMTKAVARIKSKNPYLIFENDAITIYPAPNFPQKLSHSEIDGVVPYQLNGQKFIGIVLKNEDEHLEKMPPKIRRTAKFSRKSGFPALNVQVNYLKKSDLPAVLEQFEAIGLPLQLEIAAAERSK
ncbi:hypothetical protein LRR81_08045 [Metabacillus sp. GX 13764]|uniref:STM3941 family protein n=1 Tax=Metabacillus kandeliae TaxID=2900151 RepID=UPI001E58A164|nr:STM3941 family protein [Metabacillus kandeliae]MCD7034182.1 hypothetical protein [Metabacillus kandeliae]